MRLVRAAELTLSAVLATASVALTVRGVFHPDVFERRRAGWTRQIGSDALGLWTSRTYYDSGLICPPGSRPADFGWTRRAAVDPTTGGRPPRRTFAGFAYTRSPERVWGSYRSWPHWFWLLLALFLAWHALRRPRVLVGRGFHTVGVELPDESRKTP